MIPFVFSIFLYLIISRAMLWLQKRFNLHHNLSLIITVFLFIITIVSVTFLTSNSIDSFIQGADQYKGKVQLLNLASLEISGIDLNVAYGISSNFSIQVQHSHLFYYKNEGFPGTGFDDILGENGYPAWRNNITLDYSKDKTNIRLIGKTVGEHEKSVSEEGDIPSYTEFDLNYSRILNSNSSFTVGVQNLLKSEPPLDDSNQNAQLNASLYNPRGQNVFVGFKHRF